MAVSKRPAAMPIWTMADIAALMGDGEKRCRPSERANRVAMRKSVTALVEIPSGTRLTLDLVGTRRPCPDGALPPARLVSVLGRRTTRAVEAGEAFFEEMLV